MIALDAFRLGPLVACSPCALRRLVASPSHLAKYSRSSVLVLELLVIFFLVFLFLSRCLSYPSALQPLVNQTVSSNS